MKQQLNRNQFRTTHDQAGISWVEIKGQSVGLARGDVVVWQERPCGCCVDAIRIERRVAN